MIEEGTVCVNREKDCFTISYLGEKYPEVERFLWSWTL